VQDFSTLDLEDFRHNYVNITGLRLVDHEDPVTRDTLQQMRLHQHHTGTRLLNDTKQLIINVRQLQLSTIRCARLHHIAWNLVLR